MPWPCYWLEPAGRVEAGLRRYTRHHHAAGSGPVVWSCSAGWHEALRWRGLSAPERWTTDPDTGRAWHALPLPVSHDDPAWPAACARGCGYRFGPDDEWQEWEEPVYRAGNGVECILHAGWAAPPGLAVAGPGAMWDGWWLPAGWKGPDGIGLLVRCPAPDSPEPAGGHDWAVDAPATGSGGRWTRAGDPRRPETLTVAPSIAIGHPGRPGYYHGLLQAGVLTDHLG